MRQGAALCPVSMIRCGSRGRVNTTGGPAAHAARTRASIRMGRKGRGPKQGAVPSDPDSQDYSPRARARDALTVCVCVCVCVKKRAAIRISMNRSRPSVECQDPLQQHLARLLLHRCRSVLPPAALAPGTRPLLSYNRSPARARSGRARGSRPVSKAMEMGRS